jgi:adenosine deaminase
MRVKNLRAHVLAIPTNTADRMTSIISTKIDVTREIKYLVEETDWDQEIMKGEKWIDFFCWSVLGIAALYFGVVCLRMLLR